MVQGTVTYKSGGVFKGTFQDEKWNKGIYKKSPVTYNCEGDSYGSYVDQKMSGKFLVTWENGDSYDGGMQANK